MSYPINYPTPQGANVQIFYTTEDWVKPQGASFVWFTLIGAGGGGGTAGGAGGGSGAVTNFMGPAFLMPDILRVSIGSGGVGATGAGGATTIVYQQKDGTGYTLLTANGGSGGNTATGATASTGTAFTAMGFFQSVAGQNGSTNTSGYSTPSTTTFLSGGSNGGVGGNYGYQTNLINPPTSAGSGFFQFQPIIVGLGCPGVVSSGAGDGIGGIGCGGGTGSTNRRGGDGLVVIITW